jgi:hypothetical protein
MHMRHVLLTFGLAGLAACVSVPPAVADCRSENAACVKGASGPFDSVACGSLYRTCATHEAAQRAKKPNGNVPALQNAARPGGSGGGSHSGRR